jgi:pimeloyl-ACP methyl ester carboxylesterase
LWKSITIEKPKEKLSFKVPGYISGTIRFLERIHPALASKLAMYIFFRPISFPTPKREVPWKKASERFNLSTSKSKFTAYKWSNKGEANHGKVLLVHGWSGRATQFFAVGKAIQKAGYTVYGIDAPAHGNSTQKSTTMLEFVDAIEVMFNQFGKFDCVIGHSLGGMALFNAIDRFNISSKIVIIGTPASVPHVVNDFSEKVGGSEEVARRICARIERDFQVDLEQISTNYLASKHNLMGLIMHDENDLDVSIDNARAVALKWPNANLVVTKGLGHRRILMDRGVIDTIVGFLPLS